MLTGAKAASPVSSCCRLRPATWLSVVHEVVVVRSDRGGVIVLRNVVSEVTCTTTPTPGVVVIMNVLPDSVVDVGVDVDLGEGVG